MVSEHNCDKCNASFGSKKDLQKHFNRKYPCNEGKFKCQKCSQTFTKRSSRDHHRRHTCKGVVPTRTDLQVQLDQYKTVLAATGTLGERRPEISSGASASKFPAGIVHHNNVVGGDVVEGDKITNIHNHTNIFVLPARQENTQHLQQMTFEELKEKIGLEPNESTMKKLFKVMRLDENHPENHTLLLPDPNGEEVHYKSENGWKTGSFDNRMLVAFSDDADLLKKIYPKELREDHFYQGFLLRQFVHKIGSSEMDKSNLKQLGDEMRPLMHALTVVLAEKYTPTTDEEPTEVFGQQVPTTSSDLRLRFETEKLRKESLQLELQLEQIRERRRDAVTLTTI